jgi:hypothetical protein
VLRAADRGAQAAYLWEQPDDVCIGSCVFSDPRVVGGGRITQTGSAMVQLQNVLSGGAVVRFQGVQNQFALFKIGTRKVAVNHSASPGVPPIPGVKTVIPGYGWALY